METSWSAHDPREEISQIVRFCHINYYGVDDEVLRESVRISNILFAKLYLAPLNASFRGSLGQAPG